MPALIRDVNQADLAFVLHVGDMQADGAGYTSGPLPCADATLADAQRRSGPSGILILTPGDNDWSDCQPRRAEGFRPRRSGWRSCARCSSRATRASGSAPAPRAAERRSALRKSSGKCALGPRGVLFIALPHVGDNNNRGRTRKQDAEYAERMAANLEWMKAGVRACGARRLQGGHDRHAGEPLLEETWARHSSAACASGRRSRPRSASRSSSPRWSRRSRCRAAGGAGARRYAFLPASTSAALRPGPARLRELQSASRPSVRRTCTGCARSWTPMTRRFFSFRPELVRTK